MKTKTFLKNALLLVIPLAVFSCTKEGTGGDATLVVFLKHHTKVIPNHTSYPDTVFVKFNTKELPGTKPSDFDTYFIGEAGEDHVHCEGLKAGDYYLYGAGFDATISQRVTGGIPVKIKHKERKEETDVDLPVTE
jgi:hypothetical protein